MQWQQCVRANRTIGNLAGQGFLVSEQGNALCSGKITMQEFSESTVQYSSNEVLQYIGRRWQARVVHNGGFNGDCLDPSLPTTAVKATGASHRPLPYDSWSASRRRQRPGPAISLLKVLGLL